MTLISDQFFDTTVSPPKLIGGRSKLSGEIKFPMPQVSAGGEFEVVHLKNQGTLWAYTVQRFPPGPPFIGSRDKAQFKPFAVGYVELEDQVIVETRIVTQDLESLKLGMPMILTTDNIERADGEGTATTYAFMPSQEVGAQEVGTQEVSS